MAAVPAGRNEVKLDLVFIETEQEAQLFSKIWRNAEDMAIVALSPWAEYALACLGIPYTRPEDYYDVQELEKIGLVNYEIIEKYCELVDKNIHKRIALLQKTNMKPAWAAFFQLKIMYDAVSIRAHSIYKIFSEIKPAKILYYEIESGNQKADMTFMNESIYKRLIPLFAQKWDTEVEIPGKISQLFEEDKNNKNVDLRNFFENREKLNRIFKIFSKSMLRKSRKTNLLLLHPTYLEEIISCPEYQTIWWQIEKKRFFAASNFFIPKKIWDVPQNISENEFISLWNDLSNEEEFKAIFKFNNVDVFSIFEEKLRNLFVYKIPELIQNYFTALNMFKSLNIRLVIGSYFAEAPDRAVAQAARDAGIPVVAVDHSGSSGYYHFPMDRYLENKMADYRLVWGEGVKQYANKHLSDGARPILIGSVLLDRIKPMPSRKAKKLCRKLGLDPKRPVVIYTPTNLSGNNQYLSHLHRSDSDYFHRQKLIIRMFKDYPEIQCLVKLHPSKDYPTSPISDLIEDENISNCKCITGVSFSNIASVGDLFINDSPTTTLLQALITGKRIIVLHNEVMRFESEAYKMLKKSVVFAHNTKEFEEILRWHFEEKLFNSLEDDDGEFLRKYGTLGDGKSAERLIAALKSLSSKVIEPENVSYFGITREIND